MYSAEQSGWGHSPTRGHGAASQWVEASKWCGPQRLQREDTVADKDDALLRGACLLTGRDGDVGRTNKIRKT